MKKVISITIIIGLTTLCECFATDFSCGKYLVELGDTSYDILMKCNKPGWVDKSEVEIIKQIKTGEWEKIQVIREIWLYNWGPNTFMKELTLENDRLIEIKSLGYGYLDKDIGSFGNVENKLYLQMSKSEALINWGEPSHETNWIEEKLYKADENSFKVYNVTMTKWIYDFGPKRFLKSLLFENNRLVSIETGKYGYNSPGPNK